MCKIALSKWKTKHDENRKNLKSSKDTPTGMMETHILEMMVLPGGPAKREIAGESLATTQA